MARNESDREDLYEELGRFELRWELMLDGRTESCVAGIRSDGRFALYVTPDQVYQFDANALLIRAYSNGDLYRTQGSTLARLKRQRTERESHLLRHDLTPDELKVFLEELASTLDDLMRGLKSDRTRILRTTITIEPLTGPLADKIERCRTQLPRIAPAYKTRRS
ncbi:hypothetical protein [Planctomicrobium sp. SH527]|uniref:hypothetical protein n=1 Tax=Planctomicrobium sp. SH527 TaxID=3448123 RepID=UPI003F5C0E86